MENDDIQARMARIAAKREARIAAEAAKPVLSHEEVEARLTEKRRPGRPRKNGPPATQILVTYKLIVTVFNALCAAGEALPQGPARRQVMEAVDALNERTGGHVKTATVPQDGRWGAPRKRKTLYRLEAPDGIEEGLTVRQCADRLGVSAGTIKSRIQREDAYTKQIWHDGRQALIKITELA